MTDSEHERPGEQERPFLQGVMQEAKSDFRTSLRWALWGAGLCAVALGGAGLWYFGTSGLAIGAAIGAIVGGVGSWLFYVNSTSVLS